MEERKKGYWLMGIKIPRSHSLSHDSVLIHFLLSDLGCQKRQTNDGCLMGLGTYSRTVI